MEDVSDILRGVISSRLHNCRIKKLNLLIGLKEKFETASSINSRINRSSRRPV